MEYLKRFLSFFGRRSPVTLVTGTVALVAMLALLDYYLGQNFSSALFYLIPIVVVTWFVGRTPGIAISVLCGISLVSTDWAFGTGEHKLMMLWNAAFPFFFFMLLAVLLTTLKQSLAREEVLSRTDSLTGLFNRRYFGELAAGEIDRSRRYRHPVSFAYVDVDNFKEVNDTLGHKAGDEVLTTLVDIFRKNLRATDRLARLGGDEFAMLLPEASPEDAAVAIDKLRDNVAEAAREHGWPITLSVGLVTFEVAPESLDEIMKEADALMYEVKDSTKDDIARKLVSDQETNAAGTA